jgi:Na+-transporting methylmalonyl-CoA/oxaloacetate decarboxylase gamma subunit
MKWRSPRFILIFLLLLIVLIIGIGVAVVFTRSRANITIAWQAPTTSFTQQDQQDIQNAWEPALLASNPSSLSGHKFTIISAQREGDWAIFSANERVGANAEPIPTEPLFFIAHLQGTTWTVQTPSSSGFCDMLKQVPETLLDSTDKHYFQGCYH